VVEESVGLVFDMLCPNNTDFAMGVNACQECIDELKPTPPWEIQSIIPKFAPVISFCSGALYISSEIIVSRESSASSVGYCASYSALYQSLASNCSAGNEICPLYPATTC
jgi:hypothetical protein